MLNNTDYNRSYTWYRVEINERVAERLKLLTSDLKYYTTDLGSTTRYIIPISSVKYIIGRVFHWFQSEQVRT